MRLETVLTIRILRYLSTYIYMYHRDRSVSCSQRCCGTQYCSSHTAGYPCSQTPRVSFPYIWHTISQYIFAASVVRTAAVNKVPNRDEYLRHLLGHLKETPQQRSSNEVGVYIDTTSFCRGGGGGGGGVVLEYHTSYHGISKPLCTQRSGDQTPSWQR